MVAASPSCQDVVVQRAAGIGFEGLADRVDQGVGILGWQEVDGAKGEQAEYRPLEGVEEWLHEDGTKMG